MVASRPKHKTQVEQVVPVRNPVANNFAAQSANLVDYLRGHFLWPSPDAGFASFVCLQVGRDLPLKPIPTLTASTLHASSQAPELASFGFYAASQPVLADRVTPPGWAAGFSRLTGRDPYPSDRHAFTFRPIEFLGIALGAAHTPSLPDADRRWLTNVITEAPKRCGADCWTRYLMAATRLASAKAAMAPISSRLRSTPAVATAMSGEPKA